MFAQPSLVHEDTSCYLGTLNNAKGAVVSFNFTHQDKGGEPKPHGHGNFNPHSDTESELMIYPLPPLQVSDSTTI
jgi:hypothetical protein